MRPVEIVAGLVARGYLRASAIGTSGFRRLAVSLGWQADADEVEHVEPYGFASHPLPGAEPLVVRVGGSADQAVTIIVADRRYSLRGLEEGDVALYDDLGSTVWLGRRGIYVSAVGACHISSTGATTIEAASIRLGETATQALTRWPPLWDWLQNHRHRVTALDNLFAPAGGGACWGQTGAPLPTPEPDAACGKVEGE
jgi:phage gp45-like